MLAPATRYPPDPRSAFILALCVITGAPLILGQAEPLSLEMLLPEWEVRLWGILLVLGASLALVGMFFQSINGVVIEQVGSAIVSAACIYYSVAIVLAVGGSGLISAGITLGWGMACGFRYFQLQRYVRLVENEVTIRRVARE